MDTEYSRGFLAGIDNQEQLKNDVSYILFSLLLLSSNVSAAKILYQYLSIRPELRPFPQ